MAAHFDASAAVGLQCLVVRSTARKRSVARRSPRAKVRSFSLPGGAVRGSLNDDDPEEKDDEEEEEEDDDDDEVEEDEEEAGDSGGSCVEGE